MKITAKSHLVAVALAVTASAHGAGVQPAAASAPPPEFASYAVAFNGTYTYRATESGAGIMQATRTMDASWQSQTSRPILVAKNPNHVTGVVTMPSKATTFSGTYYEVVDTDTGPFVQSCVLSQDQPGGEGLAGVKTDEQGTVTLDLQPLDHFSGQQTCSKPAGDQRVALLGRDFSAKVTFPVGRIGDDSIVLPATNDASLPCPSYDYTVTCDASWSGTVTLTRVAVPADEDISDLIVPLTTGPSPAPQSSVGGGTTTPANPAPAQGVGPGKDGPADDDIADLIAPLVLPHVTDAEIATLIAPLVPAENGGSEPNISQGKDMRFDPDTVKLWFRAACEGGCTGTATFSSVASTRHATSTELEAHRRGARTSASKVTQSFAVKRGSRLVGLRLSARARVSFRKAEGGRLRLVLKDKKTRRTTSRTVILRTR